MGKAHSEQLSFRGRDDDVALNSGTFTHLLNADWTQDVNNKFRVRFEVEEDAGGTLSLDAGIQYNLAGAGWNQITAASPVVWSVSSGQFTDADPTTDVLTSSALDFVAGEGEANDGVTASVSLNNQHTEHEFCLQIQTADVSDAQTLQLRLFFVSSGGELDLYSQTPTITVQKSGSTFTINQSSTVGGSDFVARKGTASRLESSTLGSNDSASRIQSSLRVVSETAGMSTATSRIASVFRMVASTLAQSDSVFRVADAQRLISDSLAGLSDSVSLPRLFELLLSDLLAIEDPGLILKNKKTLPPETMGVSDSLSRTASVFRLLSDVAGESDSVFRIASAFRVIEDSAGVSDSPFRSASVLRSISDTVGVSDSVSRVVSAVRLISDLIGLSDNVILSSEGSGELTLQVVDSLGLDTSVSRASQLLRLLSDSIGLTDQLVRVATLQRLAVDTVGLSDAAIRSATLLRLLADSLLIADITSLTKDSPGGDIFTILATDSIGLSSDVARSASVIRLILDTLQVDDDVIRVATNLRVLADSIGLSTLDLLELISILAHLDGRIDLIGSRYGGDILANARYTGRIEKVAATTDGSVAVQ